MEGGGVSNYHNYAGIKFSARKKNGGHPLGSEERGSRLANQAEEWVTDGRHLDRETLIG